MFNNVPVDGLAPGGAKPSADTMMTTHLDTIWATFFLYCTSVTFNTYIYFYQNSIFKMAVEISRETMLSRELRLS